MAKNILMIAPFDVLTGNLGSKQDLRYKEHNNKAYEAPDGVAGAKNYRTRYVGVRRADGKTYFMVKTRSTSNLNATTRKNMALTGAISVIISRLMSTQGSTWTSINNAFNYLKSNGLLPEGAKTFRKWVDLNLRNMLKFRQTSWSFTQASISFTVKNPFDVYAGDLSLGRSTWVKFAKQLAINSDDESWSGINFSIDGTPMFSPFKSTQAPSSFDEIITLASGTNPNMAANLQGVSLSPNDDVRFNGADVYNSSGVIVKKTDIVAGVNYTTIAPTA